MKKSYILLASIFLALFLGIILSVALFRSNIQLQSVELKRASVYASYAAEVAVERAMFQLRRSSNWGDDSYWVSVEQSGDEANPVPLVWEQGGVQEVTGYYWIDGDGLDDTFGTDDDDIQAGDLLGIWDTIWVRAYGQDPDRKVTKLLFARVAVGSPAGFATSTLGDLRVANGTNVEGDILARDIIFNAGTGDTIVDGNVLYIRNIENESEGFVTITGQFSQIPSMTFSSVDLAHYAELAGDGKGRYIDGDFTYSGTIDKASLSAANGLVYVTGDIYLSGTVDESMLIVAGGNIYIQGNINSNNDAQIGLFAHNDVIIAASAPSDLNIDSALIIADGGVFEAEGAPGEKDTLDFEGAISVRGKEGVDTGVNLNVYSTRNYAYEEDFIENRTIPFVPCIVSLINWQVPATLADETNFPPS